jgi:hypothetical protein
MLSALECMFATPPSKSQIVNALAQLREEIPQPWSPAELAALRLTASESAMDQLLCEEITALNEVLGALHDELRMVSQLRFRQESTLLMQVARDIHRQRTPLHWQDRTQCIESLRDWKCNLSTRYNQLLVWSRQGVPRVIALWALRDPRGFLTAFTIDACRESCLPLEAYTAKVTIASMTATALPDPASVAPLAQGIHIVGAILEGAQIDSKGFIAEPEDLIAKWWKPARHQIPLLKLTLESCVSPESKTPQLGCLNKVREAIAFSRANATLTNSRPSSAVSCAPATLRSRHLKFGQRAERDGQHVQPTTFFAPLYNSARRCESEFVCEVSIPSWEEHNYWMIRGVAIVCGE